MLSSQPKTQPLQAFSLPLKGEKFPPSTAVTRLEGEQKTMLISLTYAARLGSSNHKSVNKLV